MGFGSWGKDRPTFRHPSRGFRDVMAAAGEEAGSGGFDSLNLLIATASTDRGEQLLTRLGRVEKTSKSPKCGPALAASRAPDCLRMPRRSSRPP